MDTRLYTLYRHMISVLFPPAPAKTAATQDRRYLLTGMALLALPSMILTSQWSWIDRAMVSALWSAAIGLTMAIALNRFGRFNLAALVMLTSVEIPIYTGALVSFNAVFRSIDQVLVFVSAPILVACLLAALCGAVHRRQPDRHRRRAGRISGPARPGDLFFAVLHADDFGGWSVLGSAPAPAPAQN